MHQQGPHSVWEECLQTLRNDSFDTRERDTIITIITIVLYSFIYLFVHLAEGMTGVILGPGGLPTIVCMLVVVLAIFLALVL